MALKINAFPSGKKKIDTWHQVDFYGVNLDYWGRLSAAERKVWWKNFWEAMKREGSLLQRLAFKIPGDSGESRGSAHALTGDQARSHWERTHIEDKKISKAAYEAWESIGYAKKWITIGKRRGFAVEALPKLAEHGPQFSMVPQSEWTGGWAKRTVSKQAQDLKKEVVESAKERLSEAADVAKKGLVFGVSGIVIVSTIIVGVLALRFFR